MRSISVETQRTIEGGASKYVYCPSCGYKYKTSLIERLFWSTAKVEGYLMARHGLGKNLGNMTQSVHVR